MKTKINPTVVGAFVVGALVLLIFAVVNFGAGGLFRKPARFVVIVRQTSVSGLDPGAGVKFSGVRVGRIESVHARVDPETSEVVVRIVGKIDQRMAEALLPPPAPPSEEIIPGLVSNGLQAKLNFAGITGLMYLDLLFPNLPQSRRVDFDAETGAPIVPMQPSLLAEVAETLGTVAGNLAQVDFPGISNDLKAVLGNLDRITRDLDLDATLARIGSAADSVNNLAADANLRQAFERLNEAARGLQEILAGLREGVPVLQADLKGVLTEAAESMRALTGAAGDLRSLVGPRSGLADELGHTLDSISRAADGVQNLVDYLERNPSALLRGRATPTTQPRDRP